ncbi:hypothetical protein [Hyalangium gracile]|uniref:hypothetical protein n=1 Tax=Hyalangium gracile TaxID=394092 RepID=UPI001CCB481B|nr:hypothetical protein [Hyalangium gracile]
MKRMLETRNENDTSSTLESLPTIEDSALLDAVIGGAESVHLYLRSSGQPILTHAETVHLY